MNESQPRLSHRRQNKNSSIKSGRTISERRERLETANERQAARKKVKKRQNFRVFSTCIMFAVVAVIIVAFVIMIFENREDSEVSAPEVSSAPVYTYAPTVEIIDENAGSGSLTSRMIAYIGQLEQDLKDLNYAPVKAVVPAGSIREVDFYLSGVTGFIKTTIDRGAGVTAEDTDRMLRYLAGIDVHDFTYIDVRIDGKAYWK